MRVSGRRGGRLAPVAATAAAVAVAALAGALTAGALPALQADAGVTAAAAPTPAPAAAAGQVLPEALLAAEASLRQQLSAGAGERTQQTAAALERALAAWRQGKRNLALQRFAPVLADLATAELLRTADAGAGDAAALELVWKRQGVRLASDAGKAAGADVAALRPAAVRALAEAALLQARGYHQASLPYGLATEPRQGLYYLGSAAGQLALLGLARELDEAAQGTPPPVRSIAREIAALEGEMLALYRPPAAVDRHGDFITASATLKEARELDEAGLHHGALLRYLQAALQLSGVRPVAAAPPPPEVRDAVAAHGRRFAAEGVDHSLGRIFLESAELDLAAAGETGSPALARTIATDVLPRYFEALAPPPPAAEDRPATSVLASQVAVTVVRWPYT